MANVFVFALAVNNQHRLFDFKPPTVVEKLASGSEQKPKAMKLRIGYTERLILTGNMLRNCSSDDSVYGETLHLRTKW